MRALTRATIVVVAAALLAPAPGVRGESADLRLASVINRYLDREPTSAPESYRAFRRLEATGGGGQAWLEAWTSFDRGRFTYEVVGEGGSERIRNRVLHKVLVTEQESWATGEAQRSGVTLDNYEFLPAEDQPRELFKVLLKPRTDTRVLIDGAAFLTPDGHRLVRVEGRLNKTPSFWVKRVHVTRTYRPIGGANMLVEVGSRASLRMFGQGTFRMTYDYTHVNGRLVRVTNTLAAGARP